MKAVGVYTLSDQKTGKFYVGSSQDMEKRIKRHLKDLEKGRHHNVLLQGLYDQDRVFLLSFLPTKDREEAYCIEQDMMDLYLDSPLLLNIGRGVRGGDNVTSHPDKGAVLEKISQGCARRLKSLTPAERKMRWGRPGSLNPMYGRTHTEETRKFLSENAKGGPGPRGHKRSEETKRKLSEVAKQRLGVKNPFFGKHHSEETRRKLSEQRVGSKPANSRKVEVNGLIYDSVTGASRALNVSPALVIYRLKRPAKYPGYSYVV